jgi:alkylated DNA repair dioxygenase AlkB
MGGLSYVRRFWLPMIKEIIEDGWLLFDPEFLSRNKADLLFDTLHSSLPWAQGKVTIFGTTYATPRLESLHVVDGKTYSYSGNTLISHPFTAALDELKKKIETVSGESFNCVLANLYRDGKDSNGWHADNERELGINPVIASISLGAARRFDLKHNTTGDLKQMILPHGSLLIMGGSMQHYWKHSIAKTAKIHHPRINLTFRKLV